MSNRDHSPRKLSWNYAISADEAQKFGCSPKTSDCGNELIQEYMCGLKRLNAVWKHYETPREESM